MSSEEIKNELLLAIKKYSYKENHQELFTLASGKKSPHYFDLKQTLLQPQFLWMASQLFFEKIQEVFSENFPYALGGLTMGADPLVYGTSLYALQKNVSALPVVVRKAGKDHGSKKRAEGKLETILADKGELVLIDDVITTGGSTLQAHSVLQAMNVPIAHAFCLVDRLEGGIEAMAKANVKLHSIFTLNDFK